LRRHCIGIDHRRSQLTEPSAWRFPISPELYRIHEVPPFDAIYRQYFDFIWASVRRLGVSLAAADDVVQEVFIVIHSKLHTLEQPDALRSWIYGIVRRTVSGYHRAQRVRGASSEGFVIGTESQAPMPSTPFDLAEQNDKVKLLWALLEELDPPKREVFMLAELEELTVPEIARILEIPLNTAYSRLRVAREAFNEGLARRAARSEGGGRPCRA
jgi:RNA polymerase sigma-70 factor (ECF subfamily)